MLYNNHFFFLNFFQHQEMEKIGSRYIMSFIMKKNLLYDELKIDL